MLADWDNLLSSATPFQVHHAVRRKSRGLPCAYAGGMDFAVRCWPPKLVHELRGFADQAVYGVLHGKGWYAIVFEHDIHKLLIVHEGWGKSSSWPVVHI